MCWLSLAICCMLGEGMRELEFRGDVGGAYRMLDGIEIEGVKYFISENRA